MTFKTISTSWGLAASIIGVGTAIFFALDYKKGYELEISRLANENKNLIEENTSLKHTITTNDNGCKKATANLTQEIKEANISLNKCTTDLAIKMDEDGNSPLMAYSIENTSDTEKSKTIDTIVIGAYFQVVVTECVRNAGFIDCSIRINNTSTKPKKLFLHGQFSGRFSAIHHETGKEIGKALLVASDPDKPDARFASGLLNPNTPDVWSIRFKEPDLSVLPQLSLLFDLKGLGHDLIEGVFKNIPVN